MFGAKPQGSMPTSVLTYSVSAVSTASGPYPQRVPNSFRWASMAGIKAPYAGYYTSGSIDSTQPPVTPYGGITDGVWIAGSGISDGTVYRSKLPFVATQMETLEVPESLEGSSYVYQIAPDGTLYVSGINRRTYLWRPGTNYLQEFILPGRTNTGTMTYVVFWNGSSFTVIYGKVVDGAGVPSVYGRASVTLDGTVADLGDPIVASGTFSRFDINNRGQWRNPESFLFCGDAVSYDGGAVWIQHPNPTLLNMGGWRQLWGHPTVDRLSTIVTSSVNGSTTSFTIQYLFLNRDGTISTTTSAVPIISPTTGLYNIKYYGNWPSTVLWVNGTWLLEDSYGSLYRTNVDITTSSTPAWQLITNAFIQGTPSGGKCIMEVPGLAY